MISHTNLADGHLEVLGFHSLSPEVLQTACSVLAISFVALVVRRSSYSSPPIVMTAARSFAMIQPSLHQFAVGRSGRVERGGRRKRGFVDLLVPVLDDALTDTLGPFGDLRLPGVFAESSTLFLRMIVPSMVGVEKVMLSPLVARLVAGMPNFTR